MRIAQHNIKNFRGIANAELKSERRILPIGDNDSGTSSVLEATDLVLRPVRLACVGAIDEHNFYASRYLDSEGASVAIQVEVIIVDLVQGQTRHFKRNLEFCIAHSAASEAAAEAAWGAERRSA